MGTARRIVVRAFTGEEPQIVADNAFTPDGINLEGTPRPVGPAFDVGAFEGAGSIFADGFESGDASRWSSSP